MQNIDVRFNATSNFAKVEADLAALRAQAAALGTVFQKGAYAQQGQLVADPKRWKAASNAVHQASQVYRNAAASSGLLTTQQIRATSEADRFTKALQKQKLTFGDMVKNRGVMREVFRDQLRFQRMSAQYWGTDSAGRHITDIAVPKNVPTDLNNMRRQMGNFGNMARSAGNQIVNLGKNIQWSGRQLMVGFTYPMALFGAAAGVMAYKVQNAFGSINKVYDVSGAALESQALREKELGDMRVQSMEMATRVAEKYGITIDKTLAVEQQLAATGMKGPKLLQSTEEVQRISAIGDIEPTVTTEMVVALQTAFKDTIKDGEDLTNVLNFMNATSNATSLSLQDIAEATPRAASGLSQLGVTAEQMTIMLVSMREAGVQADEGANALKSATTRILNPAIVQKAQDLYKKAGASFNLKDIVEKSQGNLYDFIRMLGKATRASDEMSKKEKASAVAALFGTYQFNRLNAAIVNLGDAKAGENNQTAKAIELQQKSNEELANQAKISEDLMMSTDAAKLRKAWSLFQIQLSEMGKPFLKAVTEILSGGRKLLEWFNGLSDTKKKFAMYAAGALALVGPVIMLTGLFFNLFGQFVKGVGNIARFIGISKLLTKEEQANALATEAQNKAFMSQQTQTSTLAKEVQVLAEAYARATAAAKTFIATVGTTVMPGPAGTPAGVPAKWATVPTTQTLRNIPGPFVGGGAYTMTPQEQRAFSGVSATSATGTTSNAVRLEQARNKLAYDNMRANGQYARDATKAEKSLAAQTKLQQKLKGTVTGTGLAMGAMSVGMAGMMLSTNETHKKMFQLLMVGGLIVPIVGAMLTGMKAILVASKVQLALQWKNVAATTAATGSVAVQAGLWKVLTMNVRAFAVSLNAAMGPIGWIALAITAIGGALWLVHNHNEKIKEQQKEQAQNQAELTEGTAEWAEQAGKAVDSYKMYSNIVASQKAKTKFDTDVAFYKSDDQKAERDAYGDLDASQKHAHDVLMLTELMRKYNLTQKEAKANMVAFYFANGEGMLEASLRARNLINEMGKVKGFDWQGIFDIGAKNLYDSTEEMLQGNPEKVKALGKQLGGIYNEAFLGAASPSKATAVFEDMKHKVLEPWEDLRREMLKSGQFDPNSKMLSSANELRAAYMRMSEEQRNAAFQYTKTIGTGEATAEMTVDKFKKAAGNAEILERALIRGIAAAGGLKTEVDTLGEYLRQAVVWANMLDFKGAKAKAESLMQELTKNNIMLSLDVNMGIQNPDDLKRLMDSADPDKIEEAEIAIKAMADANNIKPGKDIMQTYWNLIHGVRKEAKDGKKDVKDLSDETKKLRDKTVYIKIKQVGGIIQDAMGAVQEDMATSASDAFDAQWDARMAGAQDAWDSRSDALQASHDRAQRALDNSQENAMDAFENRWERRKEAVNNAYEKRIQHVQNEIEAEQKADQVRQRLFEREKARLQRLAEMENANIDFNTAMREGRLDDAAKTLNNAGVSGANAAMDAEQAATEARTEAKIKALEKKNERLEKQRDKEVKQLEKMEERMRKHLERVQDARRRALERQQQQEQNALEKSEEKAMASMEKKRDYEKAMLDQRLELFKSYTARNQKDLERWMRKVGLTYDDFGTDVKAKGESWSKYFEKSLSDHIRQAGTQVANDNMWENVGKKIADKLLKGLGFDNLADFTHFVKTGSKSGKGDGGETRHEGGVVGSGKGSRGNIPNTFKGLHRSEKMIRAQKGEYVVNTKSSEKYGPILDALNDGTFDPERGIYGGVPSDNAMTLPGGYGGPVGMVSAVITAMFEKGLGRAFANLNAIGEAKAAAAAAASGSFKGVAGTYGGRFFSKEQMRNAATIASVGAKMGMNSRDIEIGIMTAITESGLVNIHGGDRDSQGLFQQRPSMGWGTVAQVTNPEYAAKAFFGPLRAHGERSSEAPWLAAQHIQRSAYSDGSNYHQWWAAAKAIWDKGLQKNKAGAGYVPGPGGRHWPTTHAGYGSIHDSYTGFPAVDISVGTGNPAYAVASGSISRSEDLRGNDGRVSNGGYYSYGRVIQLKTDAGPEVLYAHLNSRAVNKGQRVEGGAIIGRTGNTGHSFGSHLHFGATNGPLAWLKTGGTIRHDNTPVIAHRGETMLDAPLTKKFRENVGGGGGDTFNMTLDFRGAMIREDVDIERAVTKAINAKENKLGRKRVVN